MARIGIDFGTSFTTVARINPESGIAEAIRINGSEKIPSMLYYPPDGAEPMVGQEALEMYTICNDIDDKDEVAEHMACIFSGLKRNMNLDERLYLPDGRDLSYADMIGEFFAFIKREVESTTFNGEEVTDVCITHPIEFPIYKKEILIEAARKAGFVNVKLLMEPIAASMGFSNTVTNIDESILIYDFGGGTFDLAFVKFDANGDHITLPPLGDSNCGGENIDMLIYDTWDKLVKQQTGTSISAIPGAVNLPFVKTVCVKEKEFLSNYFKKMNSWNYKLRIGNRSYEMPITKNFFNNLISPVIDRTINLTQKMLERVEQQGFHIDKVILIGGSSQIPLVTEKLKEILPVAPQKVADADIAVAKGAAVFVNEDNIPEHRCYCRVDGLPLTTKIRVCPQCGTENIRYNYKYENTELTGRNATSPQQAAEETRKPSPKKCFCSCCGNQINTDMQFCNKCGSKNVKYAQ